MPSRDLNIRETWWTINDDIRLYDHFRRFWQKVAGHDQLPAARMRCDVSKDHRDPVYICVAMGTSFTIDTRASEPRISFRCPFNMHISEHTRAPVHLVNALHLTGNYADFDFDELSQWHVEDQIQSVILKDTADLLDLLPSFTGWLEHRLSTSNRPLQLVTFVGSQIGRDRC